MSKDLKARGFKFVGSTIIYAHMQATGLVNDHLVTCFRYRRRRPRRKRFDALSPGANGTLARLQVCRYGTASSTSVSE